VPQPDLFSEGSHESPSHLVGTRVLIAAIALLVLGGGFLYFKGQSLITPTDPHSLCPSKQSPGEVVAILLDPSDALGEPQRVQLRGVLQRVSNQLPRFGLIEVYRIGTVASVLPKPVIHLCNPGSGHDVSRFYSNPDLANRKWQMFADSVMSTIEREISAQQQATSPIFEAVQAIGVRTFRQPTFDGRPKHLVIVSDLLQNVPGGIDMYKPLPPFNAFKETPYYQQIRTNLSDVHVFLVYLNRPLVRTQGRRHVDFWEEYFKDQRAQVDSVNQLFGDR